MKNEDIDIPKECLEDWEKARPKTHKLTNDKLEENKYCFATGWMYGRNRKV